MFCFNSEILLCKTPPVVIVLLQAFSLLGAMALQLNCTACSFMQQAPQHVTCIGSATYAGYVTLFDPLRIHVTIFQGWQCDSTSIPAHYQNAQAPESDVQRVGMRLHHTVRKCTITSVPESCHDGLAEPHKNQDGTNE